MIDGNDESPEKINLPIPRVDPLFCAFFGFIILGLFKDSRPPVFGAEPVPSCLELFPGCYKYTPIQI